jgi:hypothetical protein
VELPSFGVVLYGKVLYLIQYGSGQRVVVFLRDLALTGGEATESARISACTNQLNPALAYRIRYNTPKFTTTTTTRTRIEYNIDIGLATMLDTFEILTTSGVVLWSKSYAGKQSPVQLPTPQLLLILKTQQPVRR